MSDALRRDAESYAEAHDVPLDEAIRRLKQQDPVGELNAVLQEQETGVFGGLWIQHEPEHKVIVLVTGDAADRERIRHRYVQGGPLEETVEIREAQATLAELETAQAETLRILEEIGSRADTGVDVRENCVSLYVADSDALLEEIDAAGLALPDHVCIESTGPYAETPPLDPPPGVVFPRQHPPEGLRVEMTALLIGELRENDGCLRIGEEGHGHLIIWPYDHTVTAEDGMLQILDGSGVLVARVGDVVRVGGGETRSPGSATPTEIPARCTGPYWIAGSQIESVNLQELPDHPDIAPLLRALRTQGYAPEEPEESQAAFLQPEPGIVYRLDEHSWLHLHLFPDEQVAQVRADSIPHEMSNSIVDWVAPPHFYRCGRVIALYLGADETLQEMLAQRCYLIAGPQPDTLTSTPTLTADPTKSPIPLASPTASPSEVLEITPSPPSTDTVLLAREDGALVLKPLSGEPERVLLDPGRYPVFDAFLIPIGWPVRLSPDGEWLLVPTPKEGTWLVALDGETRRQVAPELLAATWVPDSRHIVFRGELGPETRERDYEIYVQDVVGEGEPRLLARLPEKVSYPTWSPGCGDIHDSRIAVLSSDSFTSTVWLLDAVSGEQRALGQFSPQPMMGTPDMLRWSPECDAVWVSAYFGPRAFPVDGSGPRPLVSAGQESHLSPDGTLRVATESLSSERHARLVVARVDGSASVTYTTILEQPEKIQWTADGRRILVASYTANAYTLWALDPAVGEPEIVAENITFLGTLDTLRRKSTEAADHAAILRALPDPGPPSTWNVHDLPQLGIRLSVPPAWRFEVQGSDDYWTIVLANFDFEGPQGNTALGEEHLEIEIVRFFRASTTDAAAWLARTVQQEQHYARVEPATVGDSPAAWIRPLVAPVSEQVRVILDDGEL
ncbi:MAG: hypothetical protein JXD18_13900, partial [Anaerolineae bacterium]|nr:hypothetical protein [Anaerolineae bacterium]